MDDFDDSAGGIAFGAGEMSQLILHDEVPPTGKTVTHAADSTTLSALAERLSVEAVADLQYEALLTPISGGCLLASGKVQGRVQQICGVTLEPMWTQIDLPFTLEFHPTESLDDGADAEGDFDSDIDSDVPEIMQNGQADIGEAVAQLFAMEVPPYPRKPDAEFAGYGQTADEIEAEDKAASPFAALAALKGDGDDT